MDERADDAAGSLISLVDASVQLAPVPMLAADGRGRMLTANAAWREMTGLPLRPQGDEDWLGRLDHASLRHFQEALDRTRATGRAETVDIAMSGPAGTRWTRWWLQRRDLGDHTVVLIAAVDVHAEKAQEDDLRQLATHDDLTGLVNRRFFLETVEQALRRAERFGEPVCLLYIDLDGFKAVNDQAGHAVGDRVLAAVAGRLRLAVRGADVVARIGGDEFAVLVDRLAATDEAALVAKRIEAALFGSVEVDGDTWPLSASIGVAISSGPGESALALLARADEAMYRSKRDRDRSGPVVDGSVRYEPVPEEDGLERPSPGLGEEPLVVDVRKLRLGMESIRESLELLLRGLKMDID